MPEAGAIVHVAGIKAPLLHDGVARSPALTGRLLPDGTASCPSKSRQNERARVIRGRVFRKSGNRFSDWNTRKTIEKRAFSIRKMLLETKGQNMIKTRFTEMFGV